MSCTTPPNKYSCLHPPKKSGLILIRPVQSAKSVYLQDKQPGFFNKQTEEKNKERLKYCGLGTSLVAQWIRLHALNAGGLGSIPGQGTRSHMHAATKSLHATTKAPARHN